VVLAAIRRNPAARSGGIGAIAGEVLHATRHIVSTTLTTTGGFLPLILAGGDFWPPLAVVIAGGVGLSVVLGLFFTPALYRLIAHRGAKERLEAGMVIPTALADGHAAGGRGA
jgi:multidrug efflux pump